MIKPTRLSLCLPMLGLLVLGGCVGKDGGSAVEASASSRRSRDDDGGGKDREPRRVCENTSIGGEPKSFCY